MVRKSISFGLRHGAPASLAKINVRECSVIPITTASAASSTGCMPTCRPTLRRRLASTAWSPFERKPSPGRRPTSSTSVHRRAPSLDVRGRQDRPRARHPR